MRVALLCVLATGLVRGAPLGQRSLDAHLGLSERDVAALEKMDTAPRCDDLCNEGKFRTYSWAQKCNWVVPSTSKTIECKGCKECTPEGIAEDRRRRQQENKRKRELRKRRWEQEFKKALLDPRHCAHSLARGVVTYGSASLIKDLREMR